MQRYASWFLLASALLVSMNVGVAQDFNDSVKTPKKSKDENNEFSKKDKKDKGDEENARMAKILEKPYKTVTTERDRVIKEFTRINPSEPLGGDFDQWFQRVAPRADSWDRTGISRMDLAEIHDRMAERLQLQGTKISRADFLGYADKYWRAEDSPPWKFVKEWDAAAEADKLFKHLDRDRDGVLTRDEIPAALRSDLRQWDKSGDNRIDSDEYRAYFPHRLQRLHTELTQEPQRSPSTKATTEDDERPQVIRAGNLPAGLPAWFTKLDSEMDGQIALYEWRRAGLPVSEFAKIDLDDDGLLVPEEVLRLLATTASDGSRPYVYLSQSPIQVAQRR